MVAAQDSFHQPGSGGGGHLRLRPWRWWLVASGGMASATGWRGGVLPSWRAQASAACLCTRPAVCVPILSPLQCQFGKLRSFVKALPKMEVSKQGTNDRSLPNWCLDDGLCCVLFFFNLWIFWMCWILISVSLQIAYSVCIRLLCGYLLSDEDCLYPSENNWLSQ